MLMRVSNRLAAFPGAFHLAPQCIEFHQLVLLKALGLLDFAAFVNHLRFQFIELTGEREFLIGDLLAHFAQLE